MSETINQFPVIVDTEMPGAHSKFILTKELAEALIELSYLADLDGWQNDRDFIDNVLSKYRPKSAALQKDYLQDRDDILLSQEKLFDVVREFLVPLEMAKEMAIVNLSL